MFVDRPPAAHSSVPRAPFGQVERYPAWAGQVALCCGEEPLSAERMIVRNREADRLVAARRVALGLLKATSGSPRWAETCRWLRIFRYFIADTDSEYARCGPSKKTAKSRRSGTRGAGSAPRSTPWSTRPVIHSASSPPLATGWIRWLPSIARRTCKPIHRLPTKLSPPPNGSPSRRRQPAKARSVPSTAPRRSPRAFDCEPDKACHLLSAASLSSGRFMPASFAAIKRLAASSPPSIVPPARFGAFDDAPAD